MMAMREAFLEVESPNAVNEHLMPPLGITAYVDSRHVHLPNYQSLKLRNPHVADPMVHIIFVIHVLQKEKYCIHLDRALTGGENYEVVAIRDDDKGIGGGADWKWGKWQVKRGRRVRGVCGREFGEWSKMVVVVIG
ncbi:hypothetical protein PIB30_062037 [Stylosanthes scabra]|uniref:Uncharacterized protein n=1 Tax=Stylosanthes scabra TaxID=79078 RepID=A0ABU6YJW0_9FABA|nr:hypothetical protein [Stylosanthes scabra]